MSGTAFAGCLSSWMEETVSEDSLIACNTTYSGDILSSQTINGLQQRS